MACNLLTPYQADDFAYHFRFDNGERVDGLEDIIPSMKAHASQLNGRLVAHAIVQVFEMLPKVIFDFVNAGVFVALLLLMLEYTENRGGLFPLMCLFGGVVVFVPAFGEVFLWLDGSLNYLWAIVINLLFLLPFYEMSFRGKSFSGGKIIALTVLGFFAGAFQETMSAVTVFAAVLMLIYARWVEKKRPGLLWLLPLASAAAGLIFMATQPAEIGVKTYGFDLPRVLNSFLNVMKYFEKFGILICIFAFAFTLCIIGKADKKRLWLAGIFFLAFLAANCMMIVAAIYPERTASPAAIFLIISDAIVIKELFIGEYRRILIALSVVLFALTAYNCVYGAVDIASTYAQYKANVNTINEYKAAGQTENILLSSLYGNTKFSVGYGIGFPTAHDYLNEYISKYFEVDSIVGEDYYAQFFGIKNPERTIY